MNKIPSFTIDHERLLRGIYVSRKDEVGNEVVTTFDIRMKEPNREPVLHVGAIHTIEHLAATYLRNDPEWKDRVVYWGPMGCLTGNYLILQGDLESKDIVTIYYMTSPWQSGNHVNSSQRCWITSQKLIFCIRRKSRQEDE